MMVRQSTSYLLSKSTLREMYLNANSGDGAKLLASDSLMDARRSGTMITCRCIEVVLFIVDVLH